MKKQTISFLLSLVLLLSLFPVLPVGAVTWENGQAGDWATWSLDKDEGILSFEGRGEIRPMSSFDLGWWDDGEFIREIRFGSTITAIGDGAFSANEYSSNGQMQRLRNVRSILIPDNIRWIGKFTFFSCNRLDEITVLNPDCKIGENAYSLGDPARTVVVGYPGSTAERYAAEYSYTFRAIRCEDGAHVYQDSVVTPQTCTEAGLMDSECVICGFKTQRSITASHDYVVTERSARTVYTCTRCGDSFIAGECAALKLDESIEFTVNAEAYPSVSFTPEQTERYYIWINQYGAESKYSFAYWVGEFLDSDGNPVRLNNNTAVLEAGKTYYYTFLQVYDDALPVRASVEIEHEYVQTETEATCTQRGIGTYTCVYCGRVCQQFDDPLGHDYVGEIIKEPSCTLEGVKKYTCTRCGESYTEVLPEQHSYNYDTNLPWYKHATCSICGNEYVFGTPEPTVLELGKTITAHFDENGMCFFRFTARELEQYSLKTDLDYGVQGNRYGSDGSWYGVYFSKPLNITDTLGADRTYYYVINRYEGNTETFKATLELAHYYQSNVTTPATCTSEGVMTYFCIYCDDTYTEPIPASHEWIFDVDLPWYQHAVCALCGKEQDFGTKTPPALTLGQESVPVFDENSAAYFSFTPEVNDRYYIHFVDTDYYDAYIDLFDSEGDYVYGGWFDLGVVLDAGQTYYYRFRSSDDQTDPPPVLLEQVHSVWYETVTPPSCTEEGLRRGICEYCGETISEILPASHAYEFDVILPWYKHGVCERCGNDFEDGSLTPPELRVDQTETAKLGSFESKAFFRFTPEKTGAYSMDFSGHSNVNCDVYFSSGNRYKTLFSDAIIDDQITLQRGWTYYLGIYHSSAKNVDDVPITLHLVEELTEPSLQLNERMPVRLDYSNSLRYFSFTPAQDGYYEFSSEIVDLDGYTEFMLFDESGTEIAEKAGFNSNGFKLRYELRAGQTYHLAAGCHDYYGEPFYYLSVRQVDALYDMTELTIGKTEMVNITNSGERVFFRFTPEESGYYMFSADSGRDTVCWLYNSEMNQIGWNDDAASSFDFLLNAYLEAGQTYYYEPAFYGAGTGSFLVLLEKRDISGLEGEVIQPGESKPGMITQPEGAILYTFTPEKTDLYAFYSTSENDTYCLVYDAFGNRIADDDDSGDDSNFWLELPLQAGMPYQFAVRLYNSQATGSFQVTLQQVHNYNVYDAAPTCTEAGGTVYTCEFCGESHTENAIPALGHSFGEWAVKKAAVCAEAGQESRVCTRCGEEEARAIAAPGHDWGEATYVWSEDNDRVTATRVCRRDAAHTETETVRTASRVIREATADAEGEQILTATFQNRAFAEQSKTVPIPKTDKPDPKPQATFSDMPAEGHWAHDAIAWAVEQGVTTGTSDTTFSPNSGCTRAQVVTFLWRAAGKPEPSSTKNPFADVKSDAYYYKAVLWAVEQGITKGTSESKFSPDAVCTRAQIVTFLWRFSGSSTAEKAAAFGDVTPGAYYEKAVSWAAEAGVTTGTSDTTFSPDSTCTRAQVVTFLYRDIMKTAG